MHRGNTFIAFASLLNTPWAHPFHGAPSQIANPLQPRQAITSLERFRPQQRSTYVAGSDDLSDFGAASTEVVGDYVAVATRHLQSIHPNAQFRQVNDNHVSSSGVGHVYFKQTVNNIDIDDADFNVNVRPDGSILSHGDSFYTGPLPEVAPPSAEIIDPKLVLETVVDTLGLPINPDEARISQENERSFTAQGVSTLESPPKGQLVYYRNLQGALVSAWRVETDVGDAWLTSYVEAENDNNIIAVTDYVSDAVETYQVFQWPLNDPRNHKRTLEILPRDVRGSPLGWHQDASNAYFETRGNNAIAQPNTDGDGEILSEPRPTSPTRIFRAPFDQRWQPSEYINASTIQLFYTANKYRDILYALGFTEGAGNFQASNLGRGGIQNDSVILNTQDGSGLNNANFATPPDGQQGRMRMYVWNYTMPFRDSSFEAGVVIHEYTHGLTNRMTGGPGNSRCLQVLESGGMGEGWSDFYATALRVTNKETRTVDYPIGDYVFNNPAGIRAYKYSTSLATNPYTYSALNGLVRVHQYGTVWCSMLYEVLWNLIDQHGNTPSETPIIGISGIPEDGRYLAMKLVLDGLALQPCNPTFIQARNAILDADKALTGGVNQCSIWRGFAKRGLGEDAQSLNGTYSDGFIVPAGVC